MDCIQLMVEEHKNIKRMLVVIRKLCYRILKGEKVEYGDFFKIIDFIRNYADKHHHGKEENFLFGKMTEELGETIEKIVKHGMLTEHDLARFYTLELEGAVNKVLNGDDEARLDVIANAITYVHLLERHIDKEDNVVYKYAQNNLSKESYNRLNEECKEYNQGEKSKEAEKKYIALIEEFESYV